MLKSLLLAGAAVLVGGCGIEATPQSCEVIDISAYQPCQAPVQAVWQNAPIHTWICADGSEVAISKNVLYRVNGNAFDCRGTVSCANPVKLGRAWCDKPPVTP